MFCPTCGSENAEVKFCTRCGANLALVAEVVSGKIKSSTGIQERRFNLVKNYYNGRRSTLLGAGFLVLGLALMTPVLTGLVGRTGFLTLFAMGSLIYGAICLVWGIGTWMESSSEMKAIELTGQGQSSQSAAQPPQLEAQPTAISNVKPTDPIIAPGSVTENTTRQLDERGYSPPAATRN
jgi:hypothetical protein